MTIAIVTGAAGLVGAAAVKHFAERGMDVVGIDNDMRKSFFWVGYDQDLRHLVGACKLDISARVVRVASGKEWGLAREEYA